MSARRLLPIALLVSLAAPAAATTYSETETRCPVGGKTFKHMAIGSYTTFGQLPDGMPIGTGPFPMPITECPDNGLVIYREFNAEEAKRLEPLVLGPAYQAMRKADTPARRAAWLAERMGDREGLPWMLLTATWEAKATPADTDRITRYQKVFLAAVAALPVDPASTRSIVLRSRAANALRELGRFDEAERLRASVVVSDDAAKGEEDGAQTRAGMRDYLTALAAPIARRDTSRAPIDMAGEREAAFKCASPQVPEMREHYGALNAFEIAYCARPELRELVAQVVKANAPAK